MSSSTESFDLGPTSKKSLLTELLEGLISRGAWPMAESSNHAKEVLLIHELETLLLLTQPQDIVPVHTALMVYCNKNPIFVLFYFI